MNLPSLVIQDLLREKNASKAQHLFGIEGETHAPPPPRRRGEKESGHPFTRWFLPVLADFLNPSRFRKRPVEQSGGWPTVD